MSVDGIDSKRDVGVVTAMASTTAEDRRLQEKSEPSWRLWGPYVSERQWGTVREDYSANGDAWNYFPHDHARSRAYRWGEDGLAGICDAEQRLCLALALWNGKDEFLKERLFGLANSEGNHGEDVKEYYYYLDATPSHSYLRMLYKYPQREYPYSQLVQENARRSLQQNEFELIDTCVFEGDRYWDVFVEYGKAATDDILVQLSLHNRGPDAATVHVLPHLWFRNTWSWEKGSAKPLLAAQTDGSIVAQHESLGTYYLYAEPPNELLFCDNETNLRRLYGVEANGYFKDAFHDYVVKNDRSAVNPDRRGTKAAVHYTLSVPGRGMARIRLRLSASPLPHPFEDFDDLAAARAREADEYFAGLQHGQPNEDARLVQRQAFAGMIWSRQFYQYEVRTWLSGDPNEPAPPPDRRHGRNSDWTHFNGNDILSMPDKWEYPWFAAWDLAFHAVTLALVDAEDAKRQLIRLGEPWYMHPSGELPAYEWNFGDVNPPLQAWAAWRVFQIDRKQRRQRNPSDCGDLDFLARVLQKQLLTFTWWVNRKDAGGRNLFQGGFLGLDNIAVFDRDEPLPTGGRISQADGTSWMGMFALNLLRISIELAVARPRSRGSGDQVLRALPLHRARDDQHRRRRHRPVGRAGRLLLQHAEPPGRPHGPVEDPIDGGPDAAVCRRNARAVDAGEVAAVLRTPGLVSEPSARSGGAGVALERSRQRRTPAAVAPAWSPHEGAAQADAGSGGVSVRLRRAGGLPLPQDASLYISRWTAAPLTVDYEPAESRSRLFGGNSNWRGPIWFPVNFLIIESLQKFHHYYGDDFRIECPTGSGRYLTIDQMAEELTNRLARIFLKNPAGVRQVNALYPKLQQDGQFRDYLNFYEYFDGDTGRGVGASHQTGWTGLIAKLLQPRAGYTIRG